MFEKFNEVILKIEKLALLIMLPFMILLGLVQILSRFVFQSPITWSEALLTYLFVWTSFIGASLALNYKVHFGVEVFVELFSRKAAKVIEVMMGILMMVFIGIVMYKGFFLANVNGDQMMTTMPFSMKWPYLSVPISFTCMAIHIANNTIKCFIEEVK